MTLACKLRERARAHPLGQRGEQRKGFRFLLLRFVEKRL
jgi:hypothetical protein